MKKRLSIVCLLGVLMLTSCGTNKVPNENVSNPDNVSASQSAVQPDEVLPKDLSAVTELLGQSDEAVADALGGGEENWSPDKTAYIGRIYKAELYGSPVKVFTSCDEQKTVSAVSVWIADDTTKAAANDLLPVWQEHISAFTGVPMQDKGTSEESGSKAWVWQTEDTFYTLHLLGDVLSLDINPAKSELS